MKTSAGILMFRGAGDSLEVLLAHPGGPFWARKDDGAWSIPKGEIGDSEEALAAARREFEEEMGSAPAGEFHELAPIRQAGGKVVKAWAVRGDFDPQTQRSDTFTMEWPPKSGRLQTFPEVDRAQWFALEAAKKKVLASQLPLLDQLVELSRTQTA